MKSADSKVNPTSPVFFDESKQISLADVRDDLIRQEETIIFALIERAQFARNTSVYAEGQASLLPSKKSYLDFLLRKTEELHAMVGRYTSPDEHPFFPQQAAATSLLLPRHNYPRVIQPNNININNKISSVYTTKLLPGLCPDDKDDGQYGSTAVADIAILQAVSKRVHFGKFVAEAKFRAEREKYSQLIRNRDAAGLMKELTKPDVEAKVVLRVKQKAAAYGKDPTDATQSDQMDESLCKVPPSLVAALYRDYVMPLNKEVQVAYLLQRLGHCPVAVCSSSDQQSCQVILRKVFGDQVEKFEVSSISDAFGALLSNKVASAIVPLATQQGVCRETQQELISSGLVITGEYSCNNQSSRYVVVQKTNLGSATGQDKTTLSFQLSHSAGSLNEALRTFSNHNVNLCFIESLPAKADASQLEQGKAQSSGFTYDFYVELEGHVSDSNVAAALTSLSAFATSVNMLGSYPQVLAC